MNRFSRRALALLALLSAPAAVQAQGAYLDDRSDPAALIHSLYNAIGRHEYARAWSYFADPPAASFEAYANGYADTESVEILVGAVSADGAAGSIYYSVPVILTATNIGGAVTTYSGCYTVRQVQPSIQDPPFRPMVITEGHFTVAADPPTFPANCSTDGTDPGSAGLAKVTALFTAANHDRCISLDPSFNPGGVTASTYELRFRYPSDPADMSDRLFHLYEFYCSAGAYNLGYLYYLEDDYGLVLPLSFAYPDFTIDYADEAQTKLRAIHLAGFLSRDELILSSFNPDTATLRSFSRWRGLGDAAETGTWVFENGQFRLDRYEVDPTYDGEINPILAIVDGAPLIR